MTSRALVVLFLLGPSASAQLDTRTATRPVHVKVAFTTGGCDSPTHVTLSAEDRRIAEGDVNGKCEVNFVSVPLGNYHLIVSGQTFSTTDSGNIDVTASGDTKFGVKVKRANDFEWNYGLSTKAFVAASDLAAPTRARKEFDKANELLAKQDLAQAVQKFNKAIALYPSYAVAYNNLGVIYARLGEPQRERQALEKAIGIDDHFALAYTNLGRMNIAASDFSSAVAALQKASALDQTESVTLLLLGYAELMEQRFNDAVATSRRAHGLQDHPAFVHRVAARALEGQRELAGAIEELQQFLEEEPRGPRADAARKELEIVRAISR
jgi:tetratricopeptide (TPR) repeat protein